ncbi:conserved hypothetical protein [Agrobacterium deltaense Zutra 3/1]|uniref:Calcineurin domain-containing protein n=1 Tax=Agrobacterium deltaense Zutra 3/1 TaxID=1183427 RepID=A0A1S7NY37_9HYPH|nr:metallophosphoesterase [Agrobacterium deltaense]CUX13217.1 conserved hypothetical protein [Agrobacterium deltaense Zutra 3/1]
MAKTIKIAILSDFHACLGATEKEPAASWLITNEDQNNVRTNPFAAIRRLIEMESLAAEMVFCGGDLGDKAAPSAQQYAWQEVQSVAKALGASVVLGAVGNHDIDSRYAYTDHDAKGQIQALRPRFPIDDTGKWMEYWAQNYSITEVKDVRFVLLNSSAFHGYAKDKDKPEFYHGRVSDRTLDSLITELGAGGERATNVLLCHHHPIKNEQIKITDYSQMENGDRLLNELTKLECGPWLIVHGHKHLSRVYYAPGGNTAPVVFSAGSFSAKLYSEIERIARNEFYILDLEVPDRLGASGSVRGTISVWQWAWGEGWIRPPAGPGFKSKVGFGTRGDISELCRELTAGLDQQASKAPVSWDTLCSQFPKIKYLIPEDLEKFIKSLEKHHNVNSLRNESNEIVQVQVRQ